MPAVDGEFLALPLTGVADSALDRARSGGASHADVRVERIRTGALRLRDGAVEADIDHTVVGLSVRVVHDGTWGFAAGVAVDPASAAQLADDAVALARACRPVNTDPVDLAPEPSHGEQTWVSDYRVDPFEVPAADRVALLLDRERRLLAADEVHHTASRFAAVKEQKFYADLSGTRTTQQRVRLHYAVEAYRVGDAGFESLRTVALPVGRGWEFVTGDSGYDHDAELAALPGQLAEKAAAPSVEPGRYDLVIDPTNLWLTIHESVGHATELDRALGYEANYAGTSFATPDQLNTLKYGSPLMHVTGDRVVPNGLATIGYDDDGVQTQQWDLVRDGTLVGYQTDRRIASHAGLDRSNGCAFADSPLHTSIQRMANVSLQPAADGPDLDGLLGGVENGIYIVGDNSWSIDMQRYNFQFTGQRFYRIRNGRLDGMLKDVAYQATTTDFWGSLVALGGPSTYVLGGAFNCGKAQPGQIAPVSHGCPVAVFAGVNVLNTVAESGR
jgi:TldD protein